MESVRIQFLLVAAAGMLPSILRLEGARKFGDSSREIESTDNIQTNYILDKPENASILVGYPFLIVEIISITTTNSSTTSSLVLVVLLLVLVLLVLDQQYSLPQNNIAKYGFHFCIWILFE